MGNIQEVKKRFLKNNLTVRLGCIAADLARLNSFSKMPNNRQAVQDLIEESKFFIEWTVPKAVLGIQVELVNLQVQLALLSYSSRKSEITKFGNKWSKRILELSGLLGKD
jgi:hypothetical protein